MKDPAIPKLEAQIKRWKSWKNPPGTRIYYAEKRLSELRSQIYRPPRSKPSPRRVLKPKTIKTYTAKPCPENTAYVLSREIYDLTQAMIALERLR